MAATSEKSNYSEVLMGVASLPGAMPVLRSIVPKLYDSGAITNVWGQVFSLSTLAAGASVTVEFELDYEAIFTVLNLYATDYSAEIATPLVKIEFKNGLVLPAGVKVNSGTLITTGVPIRMLNGEYLDFMLFAPRKERIRIILTNPTAADYTTPKFVISGYGIFGRDVV